MLKIHAVKNSACAVAKPLNNKMICTSMPLIRLAACITTLNSTFNPLITTTKSYLTDMRAGIVEHFQQGLANIAWATHSHLPQADFKQGLSYFVPEAAKPQVKRTAIAES